MVEPVRAERIWAEKNWGTSSHRMYFSSILNRWWCFSRLNSIDNFTVSLFYGKRLFCNLVNRNFRSWARGIKAKGVRSALCCADGMPGSERLSSALIWLGCWKEVGCLHLHQMLRVLFEEVSYVSHPTSWLICNLYIQSFFLCLHTHMPSTYECIACQLPRANCRTLENELFWAHPGRITARLDKQRYRSVSVLH